jgi:hypothetical protein
MNYLTAMLTKIYSPGSQRKDHHRTLCDSIAPFAAINKKNNHEIYI